MQSANDHGFRVVYARRYSGDKASVTATAAAIVAKQPDIILNAGHLHDAMALHRALLRRAERPKCMVIPSDPTRRIFAPRSARPRKA